MDGLIYPDGSFRSREEIVADGLKACVRYSKPQGVEAPVWFDEVKRRQEIREDVEDSYDYSEVEVQADRPVIVGLTGDWHLGANTDLNMLEEDVHVMAQHPCVVGSFFLGDLTDSANFNPAQDEAFLSFEEQRQMMLGILDYIGKDRILGLWKGNHDHKWERKNGISKYQGLSQRYNAPVFYGNAFVKFTVNDVEYRLLGSHRLRGNSIYTNGHPAVRAFKEVDGIDVAFAGHNHKKGVVSQPRRDFKGARTVYSAITGSYQKGSEYTKDSGYGTQEEDELGMLWLVLGHDAKRIMVLDTAHMLDYASHLVR